MSESISQPSVASDGCIPHVVIRFTAQEAKDFETKTVSHSARPHEGEDVIHNLKFENFVQALCWKKYNKCNKKKELFVIVI